MNLLDLPRDEFTGYLAEMAQSGVPRDRINFLRREYRKKNSPFKGIFDFLQRQEDRITEEGRRPLLGNLLTLDPSKSGTDRLRSLAIDPGLFAGSIANEIAMGLDAPAAVLRGDVPAEDMFGEAFGTAGTAMIGGGLTPRPDGSVGANSLGADILSLKAKDNQRLNQILMDFDIDPNNADAASLPMIDAALSKAVNQEVIDARDANALFSRFAEQDQMLDEFYSNKSGAAGVTALAASKANKEDLDPFGFQKTKMDMPLSEVEVQAIDTGEILPRKNVTIEDLQGKVLLPFYGDRSSAGKFITGVDDVRFDQPVYTGGGIDYMLGPSAQKDSSIWASDQNISNRLLTRATELQKETGKDVVGTHISMAPDATDFTDFGAATMAELVKFAPIKKKDAKLFDAGMKKVDKNWPGVLSPDLRSYVENATTDIRKEFIRRMDSRPAQDAGFPSPAKARLAVTDPSQVDMTSTQAGMAFGEIDTNKPVNLNPSIKHSTYTTPISGTYIGGMSPIPQGLLFKDAYDRMAKQNTKTGQPLTEAHKAYTMKRQLPGQEVTQELIDYIMQMKERQK